MKQVFKSVCLFLLVLMSCGTDMPQVSRQYAVYTLRADGALISDYKILAYGADSGGIIAVTKQNEIFALNADFSRNHSIYIPPALIETVSSISAGDRLYISSWSNSDARNLVLSVDTESGKTIQIGNGSYGYTYDSANGSGPWHPQAVYSSQNYLYVAATGENIRVYRLADVLSGTWKNTAAPYCYLKTGLSMGKGSRITMQERNGDFFITADSADRICRFSTAAFEAGTASRAVTPAQTLSKPITNQPIRTFTLGRTKAAVAAGKYVYLYSLPDFLSFSFDTPYSIFTSPTENAFDKIRAIYDLRETGGSITFTASGDWGIRRYTAVKYELTGQGGMQ